MKLLHSISALALLVLTATGAATASEEFPQPPPGATNLLSGGEWKSEWGKWQTVDKTVAGSSGHALELSNWVQLHYSKPIKVEPGYRYFFAAKAKIAGFHFLKNNHYGIGFGLEQRMADNQRNGNWYDMYTYGIYREGNSDWVNAGGSWVPKDSATHLLPSILVKADNGSRAWLDHLFVWREPLPEKKSVKLSNILENPSFEIIYNIDTTPFGYWLFNPAGERIEFGPVAAATKSEAALQASSLRLTSPCRILSPSGKLEPGPILATLQVLPRRIGDGKLTAQVVFSNDDHRQIGAIPIGEIVRAENRWQKLVKEIPAAAIPVGAALAQIEITATGAAPVEYYLDDLNLLVNTTQTGFPARPTNQRNAVVTIDAARPGKTFVNPLDAYDHHCVDRVASYSIGTSGPHLEGPGRWFEARRDLGIRYVRIHNGFDGNSVNEHLAAAQVANPKEYFKTGWQNGEVGVVFGKPRINPATGKPFPPVVRIDDAGRMQTDFSAIGYYLDNSVLKGGCRPIFGLEPVPAVLAIDNDTHQPPKDMKLWQEFVTRFFRYIEQKYGREEIRQWIFETGNEPSTEWTFHGRGNRSNVLNDFLEMQDYTIAGARAVLPEVFIAGPSGPPGHFFLPLLKHALSGRNHATGETGTKLDAISYHGYMGGTPADLSWRASEEQVFSMMRYRDFYEKKSGKPLQVWNTEFAAIYLETTPKNPPDGAYDNHIQAIATLHMMNFSHRAGVERMVFFYHSPTYFAPVRGDWNFKKSPNQATTPEFVGEPTMRTFHGVIKPVARMIQMLHWIEGGAELPVNADAEPIWGLATKTGEQVKVLLYSFDVKPARRYTTDVQLQITGLSPNRRYRVTRSEMNDRKANSWYLATRDKITQKMCEDDPAVVDRLNRESEFQPESLPPVRAGADGTARYRLTLPAMSASLLVFDPEKTEAGK